MREQMMNKKETKRLERMFEHKKDSDFAERFDV